AQGVSRSKIEPVIHGFAARSDADRDANAVLARRTEVTTEVLRVNPVGAAGRDRVQVRVEQPAISEFEIGAVMIDRKVVSVAQHIEGVAIFHVGSIAADDRAGDPGIRVPVAEVVAELVCQNRATQAALHPAALRTDETEPAPTEADPGEGNRVEIIIGWVKPSRRRRTAGISQKG